MSFNDPMHLPKPRLELTIEDLHAGEDEAYDQERQRKLEEEEEATT